MRMLTSGAGPFGRVSVAAVSVDMKGGTRRTRAASFGALETERIPRSDGAPNKTSACSAAHARELVNARSARLTWGDGVHDAGWLSKSKENTVDHATSSCVARAGRCVKQFGRQFATGGFCDEKKGE